MATPAERAIQSQQALMAQSQKQAFWTSLQEQARAGTIIDLARVKQETGLSEREILERLPPNTYVVYEIGSRGSGQYVTGVWTGKVLRPLTAEEQARFTSREPEPTPQQPKVSFWTVENGQRVYVTKTLLPSGAIRVEKSYSMPPQGKPPEAKPIPHLVTVPPGTSPPIQPAPSRVEAVSQKMGKDISELQEMANLGYSKEALQQEAQKRGYIAVIKDIDSFSFSAMFVPSPERTMELTRAWIQDLKASGLRMSPEEEKWLQSQIQHHLNVPQQKVVEKGEDAYREAITNANKVVAKFIADKHFEEFNKWAKKVGLPQHQLAQVKEAVYREAEKGDLQTFSQKMNEWFNEGKWVELIQAPEPHWYEVAQQAKKSHPIVGALQTFSAEVARIQYEAPWWSPEKWLGRILFREPAEVRPRHLTEPHTYPAQVVARYALGTTAWGGIGYGFGSLVRNVMGLRGVGMGTLASVSRTISTPLKVAGVTIPSGVIGYGVYEMRQKGVPIEEIIKQVGLQVTDVVSSYVGMVEGAKAGFRKPIIQFVRPTIGEKPVGTVMMVFGRPALGRIGGEMVTGEGRIGVLLGRVSRQYAKEMARTISERELIGDRLIAFTKGHGTKFYDPAEARLFYRYILPKIFKEYKDLKAVIEYARGLEAFSPKGVKDITEKLVQFKEMQGVPAEFTRDALNTITKVKNWYLYGSTSIFAQSPEEIVNQLKALLEGRATPEQLKDWFIPKDWDLAITTQKDFDKAVKLFQELQEKYPQMKATLVDEGTLRIHWEGHKFAEIHGPTSKYYLPYPFEYGYSMRFTTTKVGKTQLSTIGAEYTHQLATHRVIPTKEGGLFLPEEPKRTIRMILTGMQMGDYTQQTQFLLKQLVGADLLKPEVVKEALRTPSLLLSSPVSSASVSGIALSVSGLSPISRISLPSPSLSISKISGVTSISPSRVVSRVYAPSQFSPSPTSTSSFPSIVSKVSGVSPSVSYPSPKYSYSPSPSYYPSPVSVSPPPSPPISIRISKIIGIKPIPAIRRERVREEEQRVRKWQIGEFVRRLIG